jgi:outer membrane protein OmpU
MNRMKVLLGTTALIGAGLVAGVPTSAGAATVAPGGALDITITGFARFRAHGGDLDKARLNDNVSTGLDFSNDTEVHVITRARDDATGVEYGGTIEFEADTNSTFNTDESWLFLRGGFGEFRFGDEDGPVDNSAVGGFSVAAGTGGIDGSVIDAIGTGVVKPANSDDSTKIRYYTPVIAGFQLGASYTPNFQSNGSNLAPKNPAIDGNASIQQWWEGALTWTGSFGGVGITASGVGSVCDLKVGNGNSCWTWGGGATTSIFGFKLGGGYFSQSFGTQEKQFYNLGIGAGLGPANVSVTYGQVVDSKNLVVNGNTLDEPWNLVFSADIGLAPGLVLAGDVGFFNNDVQSGPFNGDDDGWQGVVRLGLTF